MAIAKRIEKWREERRAEITGPDGPFTLVGRLLPEQGVSFLGSDKTCELVIPVSRVPAHVGRLEVKGEDATLEIIPPAHATVDNHSITDLRVTADKPRQLLIDGVKLAMRFRDGALRISIIDPDSPARIKAPPFRWFPVEEKYRVEAELTPYQEPKPVHLADSDGGGRDWQSPGYAMFSLNGQQLKLEPVKQQSDKSLFVAFKDGTSAHETYGAGRFLEAELAGSKLILDFNKAYNPLYTCPLPPKQNRLSVAVRAGELAYDPGT